VANRRGGADIAGVGARYAIGGTIAALLLALPVMAVAKQGGPVATVAAQQCAQERVDLGKKAFHRRYGEKHTMRNCIRRTRPKVSAAVASATENCQQELAQSGAAQFILDYAWDEDAMSECMDLTLDDLLAPDDSGDDESDDDF
jgi:hypothetical protein